MNSRRCHYEMAFEAFLDRRGTPYVPVDDVTRFVRSRAGSKAFDYIVYPTGRSACLIEVKGRKSVAAAGLAAECRQKTWVTQADLEGLAAWQAAFGEGFRAGFVFAYWLACDGRFGVADEERFGEPGTAGAGRPIANASAGSCKPDSDCADRPVAAGVSQLPERLGAPFAFAGRAYRFWLVHMDDYLLHQRPLSPRWRTVSVPRETFRRISRPVESLWPAAPC